MRLGCTRWCGGGRLLSVLQCQERGPPRGNPSLGPGSPRPGRAGVTVPGGQLCTCCLGLKAPCVGRAALSGHRRVAPTNSTLWSATSSSPSFSTLIGEGVPENVIWGQEPVAGLRLLRVGLRPGSANTGFSAV